MLVPSKVLVFVILQTCISICYHDNSDLYLGLGRYEGWPVKMFYPVIVFEPNMCVQFAWFVMYIKVWYSHDYACTIEVFGICCPSDLYERILL